MSYVSLYRKWRPRDFSEVKGQDAIVQTLRNQVKNDRVGHAYLFTGTRGTGKTSMAKILAAAVNCEYPSDGDPCCECDTCKSIISGADLDVREIDAASNNGVDSVREIRDDVVYPPSNGKYKVYIIDEAHMLSAGAFNALLKTLEEPPEYVIFILATTEAAKIPVTILSRCQRYDFHRITVEIIEEQIKKLAEKENISIEEKAVRYIAVKADGAMRDALSLLDRCAAFYTGDLITYDGVLKILGAVDIDIFSRAFNAIADKDTVAILNILNEVIVSGGLIKRFVVDLIGYLRNLLLLSAAPNQDLTEILDATSENIDKMKEDVKKTDTKSLTYYIRNLSELLSSLRNAVRQRTVAEVTFIRLTGPVLEDIGSGEGDETARQRIDILERDLKKMMSAYNDLKAGLEAGQYASSHGSGRTQGSDREEKKVQKVERKPIKPEEIPDTVKHLLSMWDMVLKQFSAKEGSSVKMLETAKTSLSEDRQTLEIVIKSPTYYDMLTEKRKDEDNSSIFESLKEMIVEYTGGLDTPMKLILDEKDTYSGVQDLQDIVNMNIENDNGKDDV